MITRLLAAALFLSAATSAAQPTPPLPGVILLEPGIGPARDNTPEPTGTGRIRGRIVDADNGTVLRDAMVTLFGGGLRQPRNIGTDDEGRFEFESLPAGRFNLSTNKPGYMSLSYGQRRPFEAGRPIELASGQTLDGVDIAVPRGGVIVARVTDENGDPIAGIRVVAQRLRPGGPQATLMTVGASSFSGTDDLGEVRLFGLPPGDYFITATVSPGAVAANTSSSGNSYIQTFFPGTASMDGAQRVNVQIGKEVTVGFPLISARLAKVSGTVRRADRSPAARTSVMIMSRGPGMNFGRSVAVQPDGTFTVSGVVPGEYELQSTFAGTPSDREMGRLTLVVSGADVSGVVISMARGATVRGRVVFEPQAPEGVRPSAVRPYITPIPSTAPPNTQDDGTFAIEAVFNSAPIRALTPTGWYLKSVRLAGQDVTDTPVNIDGGGDLTGFEVVLTNKRAEINGGAVDAKGQPSTDYAVVLFPENRAQWLPSSRFITTARPDQQGRFRLTGLPPGRYLATAVDYIETGSERDPEVLGRLRERATAITLVEGEPQTVTLTVQ